MIARLDIAQGGCFVAQAFTVGSTDEEIAAMEKGDLPAERKEAIAENLRRAAFSLNAQPAGGWC